jgi:hypothetical protein
VCPIGHGDSQAPHAPQAARVRALPLLAALALAALAASAAARAAAQPRAIDARALWVRADRVYVAAADSGAISRGMRLTFVERGKPRAAGEVVRVVDGVLAVTRLDSGSLERVRRLDRVRVLAEPPRVEPVTLLRVGFPSARRSNLLFACPDASLAAAFGPHPYRLVARFEEAERWVRLSAEAGTAPWPDTLAVRWFHEATDEEIALERGELDVAVFWPGEASTRARRDSRWGGVLLARRSRGVLAVLPADARDQGPAAARADSARLAALDQELFRGDLEPWPALAAPWAGAAADSAPGAGATPAAGAARLVVDASIPGRRALEGVLERESPRASGGARTLRLVYLDVPPDSVGRAADDAAAPLLRYAVRCPLLCTPRARPWVEAIGAGAFADAIRCGPPPGPP